MLFRSVVDSIVVIPHSNTITFTRNGCKVSINNLLGTASNAYSLATLPSKAKNLLAFASDPSGYFTTLGSTTGGFLGNVSTGFGGWLGGYTAPAADSAMGLGYYGGGALAGADGLTGHERAILAGTVGGQISKRRRMK